MLGSPFLFLEMIMLGFNKEGYPTGIGTLVFCASLLYSLAVLRKGGYLQQSGLPGRIYYMELCGICIYTASLVFQMNHAPGSFNYILKPLWILNLIFLLVIIYYSGFLSIGRIKQLLLITTACWLFFSITDWIVPHAMPAILCEGLCSFLISFLLGYALSASESYKIVQENMLYERSFC
jgi:hypothetical protein